VIILSDKNLREPNIRRNTRVISANTIENIIGIRLTKGSIGGSILFPTSRGPNKQNLVIENKKYDYLSIVQVIILPLKKYRIL
jgi:hypothetical protein